MRKLLPLLIVLLAARCDAYYKACAVNRTPADSYAQGYGVEVMYFGTHSWWTGSNSGTGYGAGQDYYATTIGSRYEIVITGADFDDMYDDDESVTKYGIYTRDEWNALTWSTLAQLYALMPTAAPAPGVEVVVPLTAAADEYVICQVTYVASNVENESDCMVRLPFVYIVDACTATPTNTPTTTPTGTPTSTATGTNTDTPSNTPTDAPVGPDTPTSTFTVTSTATDTGTGTPTNTDTPTQTGTSTDTFTPSVTDTVTHTATSTVTDTVTDTPTCTPRNTATPWGTGIYDTFEAAVSEWGQCSPESGCALWVDTPIPIGIGYAGTGAIVVGGVDCHATFYREITWRPGTCYTVTAQVYATVANQISSSIGQRCGDCAEVCSGTAEWTDLSTHSLTAGGWTSVTFIRSYQAVAPVECFTLGVLFSSAGGSVRVDNFQVTADTACGSLTPTPWPTPVNSYTPSHTPNPTDADGNISLWHDDANGWMGFSYGGEDTMQWSVERGWFFAKRVYAWEIIELGTPTPTPSLTHTPTDTSVATQTNTPTLTSTNTNTPTSTNTPDVNPYVAGWQGDANGSGGVSSTDYFSVRTNMSRSYTCQTICRGAGDANGSGTVSSSDYFAVRNNIGANYGAFPCTLITEQCQ